MKRSFALSPDLRPMEARSAEAVPEDGGPWQYEPKWDGFRCLAFKEAEAVELLAKSGKPLGRYFPELVALLAELPASRFVVDGEIVVNGTDGPSFEALQARLHPAESRIRKLAQETPAQLILFDMLADPEGRSLLEMRLSQRRAALDAFVAAAESDSVVLSPVTTDAGEARRWLSEAGRGTTDGIVAKLLNAPYKPGERAMVKVKRLRSADCVVGGFRYLRNRREVGSLLLGLYNEAGKLDHVGFTSSIDEAERNELTTRLEALRQPPGFDGKAPGGPSRWSSERSGDWEPVRPELVVEVRFDHVTGSRFRHGTKFLRWRPDKAPSQCTFEQMA